LKKLICIFLISCANFVYAQDKSTLDFPDMRSWMLSEGDTIERYIFADTALVRSTPDTKLVPSDTLFTGDNISITGITNNSLTLRGIRGPWLKISYRKYGILKKGYIWQGLVSCTSLRKGNTKFIYAIDRRADSIYTSGKSKDTLRRYLVKLKVLKDGKTITKSSFLTYDDESAQYSNSRVMSGMGLTNVENIVVISFGGEACAIPLNEYYFALTNNNRLIRLPDKMNVSDAGSYYHTETFTFPNEKNGKPDMVIWNSTDEEATEKVNKKGEPIIKTTGKKSATYIWDGVNEKITKPAM
jgi:hypothetical protein